VDDLDSTRAAILQLAPTGCGVVARRKLAGVETDDPYTAQATNRQTAAGDGRDAVAATLSRTTYSPGSHPAVGLCWLSGGDTFERDMRPM
jgi:hypothetical protein